MTRPTNAAVLFLSIFAFAGLSAVFADLPAKTDINSRFWEFLALWKSGKDCTEFFAKDKALEGRITAAEALKLRGDLGTYKEIGDSGYSKKGTDDETIHLVGTYCLKPPQKPGDRGELYIAEEQITLTLRGGIAYIVDYKIADITAERKAKQEEFIAQHIKSFAAATPEKPLVEYALLAYGQLYQIAEFDRMWDMFPRMVEVGVQNDKIYGWVFIKYTKQLVAVCPPPGFLKAKVEDLLSSQQIKN